MIFVLYDYCDYSFAFVMMLCIFFKLVPLQPLWTIVIVVALHKIHTILELRNQLEHFSAVVISCTSPDVDKDF
jgi:hypothetical protein